MPDTTSNRNQNYTGNDGRSSTFGRAMMSYIQNRMPYSSVIAPKNDELNPKYKYFHKSGVKRAEALARNSISSSNEYNNVPSGTMSKDTSFGDVMYASAQPNKAPRLRDYRVMAAYSEVSDALDEICDEFINVDDNGMEGKLLVKHKDLSAKEKEDLNESFDKYIELYELKSKGWQYARQMLTEGELFFEQIIHEEHLDEGVLGIINLPAEIIDPVYNNIQNMLIKGFIYRKPIFDKTNPSKVEKIEYIPMDTNQIVYINSGVYNESKDMVIPFLESARRPYRQLSLIEDAILIYRLVRAPERLVFNVDTGNMAPPKAEAYLKKLMAQYWSNKTFDLDQGDVVKKFNPQSMLDAFWFAKRQGAEGTSVTQLAGGCFAMSTPVPLLDGRVLTLAEMTEEYKSGKQNWVYSCNPETGEVVPGLVSWAGVTQKSAKVLKLTLDNGTEIICTPEHKYPIIGKGLVKAKDLEIGEKFITFEEIVTAPTLASVECIDTPIEVGTLTIDADEKYHSFHNFAIGSRESGIFVQNSNLGELTDLLYFIKKLYRALKVPTTRIDPEDGFKDGAEILREELKFARFIIRQQQRFAQGIKKGFVTHLKLKGTWKDLGLDETSIEVNLNVPTNFYEVRENQKLELKVSNFNSLVSNEAVSSTFAMKKYLGWKDKDILANREFKRKDEEHKWELMQIQQFGPGWKEALVLNAQAGGQEGAAPGAEGMPPMPGGGGAGLGAPEGIPEFGGAAAAEGGPEMPPASAETPEPAQV